MDLIASFDAGRYLRYAEMTALLQAYAEAYPGLCSLAEIGRSAEGRSVWAVTLTNEATGRHSDKPGYLVDANTHAGEVTGGAAAIYSIHCLLTNHGKDPVATELLDTRAFYVVPRIAVDGVETYLTTPSYLRSSAKRYPHTDELPGLYAEDVNGDGKILMMRMPHADGDWKCDDVDPRMMVRRRPEDRAASSPDSTSLASGEDAGRREGTFYKLFTEGRVKNWDGKAIPRTRRPWGLDFNRNYPAFWNPEGKQPGAGAYPLSNPETRALADFVLAHPNIAAYVAYHTTGGILLRPPSNGGDEKANAADLETFKRIGEIYTRITGYPCKSTFQAFSYTGQEALVKGADDWAYEHYGIQAYTFELWNPDGRAGAKGYAEIGVKGLLDRSYDEHVADERKRLAWQERELEGKAFIKWAPFAHPQLGQVEIGGWDVKQSLQNPPEGPILVDEVTKAAAFTFQHALATPKLAVEAMATALGTGLYKLSARVRNTGGLSTNVTQMALTMKTAKPIAVTLSGDVQLLSGKARTEVGHLEGWAMTGGRPAGDEVWTDWLVRGEPGSLVTISAATARAGWAAVRVSLGGQNGEL